MTTIADRAYVIDIQDPTTPHIVDSMMADARLLNDIMTTEDGKFGVFSREGASNRKNGIKVFDASDPCHPKVIADYNETVTGGVHSSYVYQGHVFLTDDATGSMRVIDIRDPYHPAEVGRWQTEQTEAGRYLHDIMVVDGLAYLAYWNDGVIILDVGNGMKGGTPEKPVLVVAVQVQPLRDLRPGRSALRTRLPRHPHRLAGRQVRLCRGRGVRLAGVEGAQGRQQPDLGPAACDRCLGHRASEGSGVV